MNLMYNNNSAVPAVWDTVAYTQNAFTYTSGNLLQITEFPEIAAPAGEGVSAICDVRMFRDNANTSGKFAGADPYTVEAQVKEFDVHYRCNTFGSRTEYTK